MNPRGLVSFLIWGEGRGAIVGIFGDFEFPKVFGTSFFNVFTSSSQCVLIMFPNSLPTCSQGSIMFPKMFPIASSHFITFA
jgi:hypothetical protein